VVEGVEKDARLVVDDLVENGKKAFEKIPGKKAIEKRIDSGMKSIPKQLNLPNRKDIEKLNSSMKALSQKVEALNKQYAA